MLQGSAGDKLIRFGLTLLLSPKTCITFAAAQILGSEVTQKPRNLQQSQNRDFRDDLHAVESEGHFYK